MISSSCSGVKPVSLSIKYSVKSGISLLLIVYPSPSLSQNGNLLLNISKVLISTSTYGVNAKKYKL